ncbi:hypothetical protein [Jannaschia rubra]|uniref:XRE family transcriptional regulator n=1 Tax=Jannaschia rubra TaxID=282197 RepID=A0A0M6XVV0_9RHOB|nr:hypothetical protein [Jannaschia rubra]CTQ34423.1 hypothetical protein JAN5088_03219 [Jannaschia rubra]SFG61700.1 hypothetical protein SAMN04488517_10811 [Jannaschia rubra]
MSFPKKGKFFPGENGYNGKTEQLTNGGFVEEIAAALKRSLGDSRAGVKTVAAWTGANEKTVKNWFSGTYGPSGVHLIALARHSDEVLSTFLAMAGREDLMVAIKLSAAEDAISDLLDAVRRLGSDDPSN